ncbi:hypothetical protein EVAR_18348_1 [Eumeta japonica]|uniref:Uncharacterized protein n=1 Tax=Eumeta variegata TaxID=151549 RepID=A0A4C1V9Y5_EUMVA|nr:hypothetical protein EVAR_18348_1 [Eumeta japonica]
MFPNIAFPAMITVDSGPQPAMDDREGLQMQNTRVGMRTLCGSISQTRVHQRTNILLASTERHTAQAHGLRCVFDHTAYRAAN